MAIDKTYRPDWLGVKAELEGLSPRLANYLGRQPYVIPKQYFEQLSTHIQNQINGLPVGYFEKLPLQIMDRIKRESEYHIPKTPSHPYKVPEDYFASLRGQISVTKENVRNRAKVVPIYQHIWTRIAVAATLLVGILATVFLMTRPPASDRMLARMDESELQQYVQQNIDDYELYQLIDYSELEVGDIESTILLEESDSTFENLEEDIDLLEDILL